MDENQTAIVVIADTRGKDKDAPLALRPFWGTPLVRHATLTALEVGCGPVIVVSGVHAAYVQQTITGLNVTTVTSDPRARGSAAALQAGLRALGPLQPLAAVVAIHAEQVLVTAARIRQLVAARHLHNRAIAAARYAGGIGLPACFSRRSFDWLLAIAPGLDIDRCLEGTDADRLFIECPEAERTASLGLTSGLCSGGAWSALAAG